LFNSVNNKSIKKLANILLYLLLAVFLIPGFLFSLLNSSVIQNYLAQRAATFLSGELKTQVSIKKLYISPFLDLTAEEVLINDRHNNKMFYTKSILLDFDDVSFTDHHVFFKKAIILDPYISIVKYKNEDKLNFQFISDYFSSKDTVKSKTKSAWQYNITGLKLMNAHLIYDLQDKDSVDYGLDFNHINLSELYTNINNINVNGDTIYVDITNLSFLEKSGFNVRAMKSLLTYTPKSLSFKNTSIKTPDSEILFDFNLKYDNFTEGINDFFNKVETQIVFTQSRLSTKDLSYFVHDLKGMNLQLDISADFKGKFSNLKGKNIKIKYGYHTLFQGSLALTGLPNVNETFLNADIKEFYTCKRDIESIRLPDNSGGRFLSFPDELLKLGNIRYSGKFTGFFNDFVSYGNIYSDIGIVTTDIRIKSNGEDKVISYKGKIGADNFDLGKLLSQDSIIGKISLQATVAGSGFDFKTANLTMDGVIKSIELNHYNYQNIDIDGKFGNETFNGNIEIDDRNIGMSFAGLIDLSAEIPRFHLTCNLRNVDFNELNLLKKDTLTDFSSNIEMNFKGNKFDNFYGNIGITNTSFRKSGKKYSFDYLNLSNYTDNKGIKVNKIDANFISGEVSGIKSFKSLQNSFLAFLNIYTPALKFSFNDSIMDTMVQKISYTFTIKKADSILNILMPSFKIAENSKFYGLYNTETQSLTLYGSSEYIEYNKIRFNNWVINGKSENKDFKLSTSCDKLILRDTIFVDNFVFATKTRMNNVSYSIEWKNNSETIKNSADISGSCDLSFFPKIELQLNKSDIVIRDSLLTISGGNKITLDSTSLKISNFVFGNTNQLITINGTISDIATDKLNISFKNFNLSNLDVFTVSQQLDFDGILNGKAILADLNYSPNLQTDILITNLAFNKDFIGDAVIQSSWDNLQQALMINAEVGYSANSNTASPIVIKGRYYPNRVNENLDFIIDISKFKLDPLGKFLSSFASEITGYASGNIELKGSSSKPELSGTITFDPAKLKIDYLNTVYSFANDVTFDNSSISFEDVELKDEKGKTAKLNGKIYHQNFKDWSLSLSIMSKNFFCMNTNIVQNSSFYGKAYITGLTKIYGTTENINIDVVAKTEKGTQIYIPITNSSEISNYPFISFVSNNLAIVDKKDEVDLSGIKLNFDLEVTPDAEVQIIFDSKSGDILKATGTGNLKLEITTLGDFNMYGEYLIEKGDYLFTVKNIINKRFDIVKGGSIKWNGDPYDASINLSPVYKLRTSLYDLYTKSNPNIQDPDTSKKRVPVECIINMTDNLFNPTITFDIDFPGLNDNSRQEYKAVVKPEINNQFLSLLIMNKFISPSQENTSGSNNVIGSTTSELLSNQLSNWLSQISNDFDLGVNYRAGNEMNKDELEVALSTQLFNDRVIIDGNVGTGGNNQSSSSIVGDVNIEYKITDDGRFRIKAFNRSNEIDLLSPNSPYTQGAGVFYRKEFNTFKEIFRRREKKK
jgi:hypothetical protein